MKVLVAGGEGQVGRALARRGSARGHQVTALGRASLDLCRPAEVAEVVATTDAEVVVNAAGYTAVDRAENDRQAALAVNCGGAVALALACHARGLRMFHLSTDYVFDGEKSTPYVESDRVRPVNVYGESKAAGEVGVRACNPGATIVRTSWVFGLEGQNFVRTIQRLARERPLLRVVADQWGCPTFADDIADALLDLATRADNPPLLHFCGDEPTTWHQFAEAIVAASGTGARVDAITTAEYPTLAIRPRNTVLDTALIRSLGIFPPSWRAGLEKMFDA